MLQIFRDATRRVAEKKKIQKRALAHPFELPLYRKHFSVNAHIYLNMSVFYSIGEYLRDSSEYGNSPLNKLTRRIIEFECQLFNMYPDRITNNTLLPTSWSDAFYAGLCPIEMLPIPIVPSQCERKLYIFGTYYRKNLAYCNQLYYWRVATGIPESQYIQSEPEINPNSNKWGIPISTGIYLNLYPMDKEGYDSNFLIDVSSKGISNRNYADSCINVTGTEYGANVVGTKGIVKEPEDPTCKETIVYPPSPEPPPIINYRTYIENKNKITTVDISILADVNGYFNFPHDITVNGVNVNVNFGGFEFSPGIELPPGLDGGNNSEPGIENNRDDFGGKDSGEDTPEDTDNRPRYIYLPPPEEKTVENSAIELVKLTVTQAPSNGKVQAGLGAPDVHYVGWFEFLYEDYVYPRQPIHFLKNVFSPKHPHTGFAYTLYLGYNAEVEIISFTPPTEEPSE